MGLLRFVPCGDSKRFVLLICGSCDDDFFLVRFGKRRGFLCLIFVIVEERPTSRIAVGASGSVHVKLLLYKSNCRRYV